MERRFVLFLVCSFAILGGYFALMQKVRPPRKVEKDQQVAAVNEAKRESVPAAKEGEQAAPKGSAEQVKTEKVEKAESEKPKDSAGAKLEPESDQPKQWVTLGSADPKDPYRMLVTLTNQGAAIARIDLNSPQYCDVDDRSGFLGHLIMDTDWHDGGCPVHVVGQGTPAAEAGLKPGDVIKTVNGKPVADAQSFDEILSKTRPNHVATLSYVRDGEERTAEIRLRRRPVPLIAPEASDPLSMLLTLQQFDDQKIPPPEELTKDAQKEAEKNPVKEPSKEINRELEGVHLRTACWQLVSASQDEAQFRYALAEKGLEFRKTYRVTKVPEASQNDKDFPAYHLEFELEIRNIGGDAHKVAYRLDGPTGLPKEGDWYASKVSRNWGGSGLRDFIVSFGGTPDMVGSPSLCDDKYVVKPRSEYAGQLLKYIGVDAQYFSGVLMPQRTSSNDVWFESLEPIRVGKAVSPHFNLADTSCRLISTVNELKPADGMKHSFRFFAGPKKPSILTHYGLSDLVYFGWPIFTLFAVPLTGILHVFYAVVHNYGIAIIMLTVLVRGLMFPLSRKQALGAIKMQELQPEIKYIQEKYKKDAEGRAKAQQELFRKHNYNPLSGCLVAFIQLPVFIGLYRSLMVDVELRDAPLISHAIRWCSNLAAPDMLYHWTFMPKFVTEGPGILWLGPYFNLLPILTIILFIVQQKMFMPPPSDEQAAMQQKIMQYMMIFMGIMFFKVASGLCLYFIASSLWGLGERQFLPKPKPPERKDVTETRAQAKAKARLAVIAEEAKKKRK